MAAERKRIFAMNPEDALAEALLNKLPFNAHAGQIDLESHFKVNGP